MISIFSELSDDKVVTEIEDHYEKIVGKVDANKVEKRLKMIQSIEEKRSIH